MQNYLIETDAFGKELNTHGDSMFPVAGYDEYFSKFVLGEVPWHFHEEIEIIVVLEGSTKIFYVNDNTTLNKGDCALVNSNVLHRLIRTSEEDCHIINFVLKAEFIAGQKDSLIYTRYIKPICSNNTLSMIKLDAKIDHNKDIIQCVERAFDSYRKKEFGFEMTVRNYLADFWKLICSNNKELIETRTRETETQKRMDIIIRYIHENYNKQLTVPDIAKQALISESECYRLFKKSLDTTPTDYIIRHRLQRAVDMLLGSDDKIINICENTGFGSPSYFTKRFKEIYQCTPKDFRKKYL